MTDDEVSQRKAVANDVFRDPACQAAAAAVCQRLRDAAREATTESLLYLAKIEADEIHGNATPAQVVTTLNYALHFLADVARESYDINEELLRRAG